MVNLPKSVILELTYRCNHKCKFCFCPWDAPSSTYKKGKELTVHQWKETINRLYLKGCEYFSVSGGEAMLKDGWEEIVRHIRVKGKEHGLNNPIVIISNGRLMSDESILLFKELGVHLSMSLPGYETFEWHTGVDNADNVLEWFEKAHKIGLHTTANITVTKKNLSELYETIALVLLNGADDILLNRFLPGGRGLQYMSELCLSVEEINEMLDIAEEVLECSGRMGYTGTEIPYCAIDAPQKYKHLNIGYRCGAASNFMVVDASGQIRVCNHSPRVVGSIFEPPLIIDAEYWNLFTNRNYQPDDCKLCMANKFCNCGCREVASILSKSPSAVDYSVELKYKHYYERHIQKKYVEKTPLTI